MQQILDFAPLVVFLVAYYLKDLYFATGALMLAMLGMLAADWLLLKRVPTMHWISAALVFAFGAATLLLHDQRFIQWKPTVFFWAVGLAFLASQWIGERPFAERLMAAAMGAAPGSIPRRDWLRLNLAWVAFYGVMGAANLLVAFNASERTWVTFKVVGITAATLVFVLLQSLWLSRRASVANEPSP